MGERQRQADAARLDLAPARGEVPQQQREAHLEARLRRDRPLDVEVAGAPGGTLEQGEEDLRPRADALGEGRVEHGDAAGDEDVPAGGRLQQLVGAAVPRVEQVARDP